MHIYVNHGLTPRPRVYNGCMPIACAFLHTNTIIATYIWCKLAMYHSVLQSNFLKSKHLHGAENEVFDLDTGWLNWFITWGPCDELLHQLPTHTSATVEWPILIDIWCPTTVQIVQSITSAPMCLVVSLRYNCAVRLNGEWHGLQCGHRFSHPLTHFECIQEGTSAKRDED